MKKIAETPPAPSERKRPAVSNKERVAPWLLSDYHADRWIVINLNGGGSPKTIDFNYRMPDGRPLTEWRAFYVAVKEYAWWVRHPEVGSINDAETHYSRVLGLMAAVHAWAYEGLTSFASLKPAHITSLVRRAVGGVEGILAGQERVATYLGSLFEQRRAGDKTRGALPRYVCKGAVTDRVATGEVIAQANLPDAVLRIRRVCQPIAVAAKRDGLRCEGKTDNAPPLTLTAMAMMRFLEPLQQMYKLRHRMLGTSIGFNPFPDGVYAAASVEGKPSKRIPTPAPSAALGLLQEAMTWVIDYGPTLLQLERACRADKKEERQTLHQLWDEVQRKVPSVGRKGSPWPCRVRRDIADGGFTLYEAIKFLATACWIVIATFTARRAEEIEPLIPGCLIGSDQDGWWMDVYIEKTLQRMERIPVPHVAARAVELLVSLGYRANSEAAERKLFIWVSPFTHKDEPRAISLSPRKTLDAFALHVSPAMTEQAQASLAGWHWTSHQFRRFFAVLYFYRYEDASLEVLSHHLRHFSLAMSRVYLTRDPEVRSFWLDVEWSYHGDLARAVVVNDRVVSGPLGLRLAKIARRIKDAFRRRLIVVSEKKVGERLLAIMDRTGLVLTPKPWVTCACPGTPAGASSAMCRKGAIASHVIGPDFSQAGPAVCARCPWAIRTTATLQYVAAERASLRQAVTAMGDDDTVVARLARANLFTLESAYDPE